MNVANDLGWGVSGLLCGLVKYEEECEYDCDWNVTLIFYWCVFCHQRLQGRTLTNT